MRAFFRQFILGSLVAASAIVAATSASRAQYYPWCLVISDKLGSWSCYFATRDQCMASAGGNAGFCTQNPAGPGPQSSPPPRKRGAHG
jgi:Protein of unknown function (DUF3551)